MKKQICTKTFTVEEMKKINYLAKESNILVDTASILYSRGFDSAKKINKFLNPGAKHFYNPFLFKDMGKVKTRISLAKQRGESVLVYGDYDADGICATTVLYYALKEYGVNTYCTIPNREDGYGLNYDIVSKLCSEYKFSLIITVDCGISDGEVIKEIKKLGIDVIVTDHHEIPPSVPENILIVNPKMPDSNYPFTDLCGAGVAYKVASALIGSSANKYLDFVALATVADSMDLVDENRDLVYEGLKLFAPHKVKRQFKYLLASNSQKMVTSQTLAYTLAPRINAAGRMGDALSALNLFLEEDDKEIERLTSLLNAYNIARQTECDKLYKSAKEKIGVKELSKRIIMLYDESWTTGIVGIVASRLAEEYHQPVILFAGFDGRLKGSARSVGGVNIFDAVTYAKEYIVEYGGHAQAVGVAVEKKNFEAFWDKVDFYIQNHFNEEDVTPKYDVEKYFDAEVSLEFAKEIERFEPTGIANRKPIFAVKNDYLLARRMKEDSLHLIIKTPQIELLNFNSFSQIAFLNSSIKKHVLFELSISTYNKKESLKGIVKEVIVDANDEKRLIDLEESLRNSLKDSATTPKSAKILPTHSAFGEVYKALVENSEKPIESFYDFYIDNKIGINVEQFLVGAYVFKELGFLNTESGYLKIIDCGKKSLENSKIYKYYLG